MQVPLREIIEGFQSSLTRFHDIRQGSRCLLFEHLDYDNRIVVNSIDDPPIQIAVSYP